MQPGLILAELDGNQFLANLEACAGVYAAAMNPPEEQLPGRHTIMERHAGYAAFRAIAAIVRPGGRHAGRRRDRRQARRPPASGPRRGTGRRAGATGSPLLVGFAYGFHGGGGQWWHDLVSRTTASVLGAPRRR